MPELLHFVVGTKSFNDKFTHKPAIYGVLVSYGAMLEQLDC